MRKFSLLLAATGLLFTACEKDKPVPPTEPGSVQLEFESRYGNEDLSLNKVYTTQNGDSVAIGSLLYFISNVELLKADGSGYKVPDSYFLIQNTYQKVREEVTLANIPNGEYTRLRFLVGVDSARNQSRLEAIGDLTLENHMTWEWNTGYIFMNANAAYYNPASGMYEGLVYEIGKNQSSRTVTLDLPVKMVVGNGKKPQIHLHANAKNLFGGPNVIDVKTTTRISGSPEHSAYSIKVADNYATMFRIEQVH